MEDETVEFSVSKGGYNG